MNGLIRTLALISLLSSGSLAQATLIGQTINTCFDSLYTGQVTADPNECGGNGSVTEVVDVVNPGIEVEITLDNNIREFDFTADTISLIYSATAGGTSDLFVATDLIWADFPLAKITDLELMTDNPAGVQWTFLDNAIGLLVPANAPGATNISPGTVTWRIVTDHPVPAPATLALFGLGLAGLGWSRRRKA